MFEIEFSSHAEQSQNGHKIIKNLGRRSSERESQEEKENPCIKKRLAYYSGWGKGKTVKEEKTERQAKLK